MKYNVNTNTNVLIINDPAVYNIYKTNMFSFQRITLYLCVRCIIYLVCSIKEFGISDAHGNSTNSLID